MSDQNRLQRVALEAVVIVGSILLAFAIDAAWDERGARQELASLTDLVVADIQADLGEMKRVNARADSVMARVRELLALGGRGSELPETDSLALLAFGAWQGASFEPTVSALDVAQGNPVWNRVPEGVRVDLSEYAAGWSPANREAFLAAQRSLFELAGRHGGLPALAPPEAASGLGVQFDELSREGLVGFVRDPDVRTWLYLQLAMVRSEQAWREEWVATLGEMVVELQHLKSAQR